MNLQGKKAYDFSAISIKSNIAERFRKFSKKVGRSHSETIQTMINFFEWNEISPNDSMGPNMISLENRLKKRINALVAIIKNIEKNQTKPTNAMLELLFQENKNETQFTDDKLMFEQHDLISENEELEYYRNQYEDIRVQYHKVKNHLENILDKVSYVKGNFGSGYLKLQMSQQDFENLKKSLNYVHHDNKTKDGR